MLRQILWELWVGGEPRKTAGPILRGAATSRTLQEGPNLCCGLAVSPGKPRPPTHPARGNFWSCHGSGRFGDTILWSTRDTRGARGWDASAIPPTVGFVRHFYRTVFSAALLSGGVVRVQTWMIGVYLAHIKCVSHHRGHHTARSDTPMQQLRGLR